MSRLEKILLKILSGFSDKNYKGILENFLEFESKKDKIN